MSSNQADDRERGSIAADPESWAAVAADSASLLAHHLEELETSHGHLRNLHDVLPICVECGKVKTGERRWDEVLVYLTENAHVLSHGYCPECFERAKASVDDGEEARHEH